MIKYQIMEDLILWQKRTDTQSTKTEGKSFSPIIKYYYLVLIDRQKVGVMFHMRIQPIKVSLLLFLLSHLMELLIYRREFILMVFLT